LCRTCLPRSLAPAWPTGWLDQKLVRTEVRDPSQMCCSVTSSQAGVDRDPEWTETEAVCPCWQIPSTLSSAATHTAMSMSWKWSPPTGVTLATTRISNTEAGFTDALAWITDHSPGPRIVIAIECTRSYGIGLTRALQGAGLTVVEMDQPRRGDRQRGKSDAIDAHLAAVRALRLETTRLPTPRADGDREAIRMLLSARHELTTTK
jgi:hypothetical protein